MKKTEVVVDTCFLQKLSSEGKAVDNIKKVLAELEYIPVVHPYIYKKGDKLGICYSYIDEQYGILERIKFLHRSLSRKRKGSKNREKLFKSKNRRKEVKSNLNPKV